MKKLLLVALGWGLAVSSSASWYWPFGEEDAVEERRLRLSELMEPATALIDEAADLAADGKVSESVAKYREALTVLERIELENPDRAKKPEFASLRNKRAYVNAAIDTMLLSQIREHAKAVAVSDTTELEKRLAQERSPTNTLAAVKPESPAGDPQPAAAPVAINVAATESRSAKVPVTGTPREQALAYLANGEYANAEQVVENLLVEKPNNAMALNLKAAILAEQGKTREAEQALDQAIMSNPRDYFAYYNMAELMLQRGADNQTVARRYYETGRAVGGPIDEALEARLK